MFRFLDIYAQKEHRSLINVTQQFESKFVYTLYMHKS